MVNIPPLLYSLIVDNKVDPMCVKVYRMLKVYDFNSKKNDLGTILSDLEMKDKEFRVYIKQLEDYGFIERKRNPGKKTDYTITKSIEIK